MPPRLPQGFAVRVTAATALGAAVVAAVVLVVFTRDVLLLVFAALLVAILLRGLANRLRAHLPIGDGTALAIVGFLLLGVPSLLMWWFWPGVLGEAHALANTLPKAIQDVEARAADIPWVGDAVRNLPTTADISPRPDVLGKITGFFSSTLGAVANLFIVLVAGIYLAIDPRLYLRGFAHLFPFRHRPRVEAVLVETGSSLGWWMAGKFASMAIIGVLTAVGLLLLGIPLALPLALIATLFTFVPNFGPLLSLAPAALLALAESPELALWVVLLYAGIQFVETYLITPLIQQRMVSLPPALTIAMQVFAGVFAGAIGLVLATPLTVAGMVLVRRLYVEGVLGEAQDGLSPGTHDGGKPGDAKPPASSARARAR